MTDEVANDLDFWLNAGIDYTSSTWKNYELISVGDTIALGKIFVQQGAQSVVPEEVAMEAKYPDLIRK